MDDITKKGQYYEVLLIDPTNYYSYMVYAPLGDRGFDASINLKWYNKDEIVGVFKFFD